MRQAIAALVAARALVSTDETPSPAPAQPVEQQALRVSRRRRTLWLGWVLSAWKTTHPVS